MIEVVVDEELEGSFSIPDDVQQAVLAACHVAGFEDIEPDMCIRFATDAEVHELNRQWRDKDRVTDVLSFPMQEGPEFDLEQPLGDVALAVPFIQHEAKRLDLLPAAHQLHLIIHATLHLLGYDHIHDDDAEQMQSLERQAMLKIGLHDPYPSDATDMERS
ncbi:MAG: rRNA maturation RNase YbeY [Zetaproteobacteria bacterium CG1_02_53_45]|nr:MAG: rRNA maturation RNase YbeY [Zetaproteobacteria bacterium CG1_02_53_45]